MSATSDIRLLYLIDGLGKGGAERSLAETLPRLVPHGIHPVVVTLSSRSGVRDHVRASGIDVLPLDGDGLVGRVRSLRTRLRETDADILHTTHFDSDIIGRLAAVGTGVGVVTSIVNTTYDPVRLRDPAVSRHRLAVVRFLDGVTARHLCDHFHAISEPVKEAAVRDLGIDPRDVTVVERGRDPERLGRADPGRRTRARRELGLDRDTPVLLNVARQEFQKGQRFLLEAMPGILAEHPDAVLLVAGRPGHATEELQRLHGELDLGGHVRFLGHREDVPEVLTAADLFVFPSVYEGLGGALLEALALRVPIVASDLPAIREVVEPGRSGLLVEPGRPGALTAAVLELLADRERARRLADHGREVFQRRFTLQASVDRLASLYRGMLDRQMTRT